MTTIPPFDFQTHFPLGDRKVPRLGYGTIQLAGARVLGLPDDVPGAIAVLRQAVDQGVRFFDTANAYGPRSVNQLIGLALDGASEDLVIGNKVGATRTPSGGWAFDNRPQTVRSQVEDALLDLRAERSALTYLRLAGDSQGAVAAPADAVPLEEALGALVKLRDEGKVRFIGLSGASPAMLERAQKVTPIAAVQNRFNLIDRSGVEVLAACERHGIAFVPYWPLATGLLGDHPALTAPAKRLAAPISVLALAWLLRRSPVIVPIPGTKSIGHLKENLQAAAAAFELTDDEVAALSAIEDEGSARLDRMPNPMTEALARARGAPAPR